MCICNYILNNIYLYMLLLTPSFPSTESPVSCLAFGASAGGFYISLYVHLYVYINIHLYLFICICCYLLLYFLPQSRPSPAWPSAPPPAALPACWPRGRGTEQSSSGISSLLTRRSSRSGTVIYIDI